MNPRSKPHTVQPHSMPSPLIIQRLIGILWGFSACVSFGACSQSCQRKETDPQHKPTPLPDTNGHGKAGSKPISTPEKSTTPEEKTRLRGSKSPSSVKSVFVRMDKLLKIGEHDEWLAPKEDSDGCFLVDLVGKSLPLKRKTTLRTSLRKGFPNIKKLHCPRTVVVKKNTLDLLGIQRKVIDDYQRSLLILRRNSNTPSTKLNLWNQTDDEGSLGYAYLFNDGEQLLILRAVFHPGPGNQHLTAYALLPSGKLTPLGKPLDTEATIHGKIARSEFKAFRSRKKLHFVIKWFVEGKAPGLPSKFPHLKTSWGHVARVARFAVTKKGIKRTALVSYP